MTSRSASTDGRTCMYVYAQRAGKAAAAAAEAGARDRQGTLRLEEDAPRKIRIYIYMYVRLAVVFLFVCSSTRLPARVPSASPPFFDMATLCMCTPIWPCRPPPAQAGVWVAAADISHLRKWSWFPTYEGDGARAS